MEERRLCDVGATRGLGFGGVAGHALALTRHVDQPPDGVGEAFEALPIPARVGPAIDPSRAARRQPDGDLRRLVVGGRGQSDADSRLVVFARPGVERRQLGLEVSAGEQR